jgi:hypothetical protein
MPDGGRILLFIEKQFVDAFATIDEARVRADNPYVPGKATIIDKDKNETYWRENCYPGGIKWHRLVATRSGK